MKDILKGKIIVKAIKAYKNRDLSHNGKLYFKNIRNFRFKI